MRARDLLIFSTQIRKELRGKISHRIQSTATFRQDSAQVQPRRLILRRKLNLFLCVRNLPIDNGVWHLGIMLRRSTALCGMRRVREDDEEAVRPRRVVAQVILNHILRRGELKGAPVVELRDEVLAVRPHMVVLGVLGEDLGDEVGLGFGKLLGGLGIGAERVGEVVVEEELAVVPDLVVLEVVQGDVVEPLDFIRDGELEGGDDLEAVEPDGVVAWVHADDVLCEAEAARGVFLRSHDGAEVRDGWR